MNRQKTQVMRARGRQTVTGVVVNRRPNLARPAYEALEATLTNCVRHGASSQARGAAHFREALRGRIAWVASLHPGRGVRLLALYDAVDWTGVTAS